MFEQLKTRYRDRKLDRELRRVLALLTPDERAELSSVLDQIATLPPDRAAELGRQVRELALSRRRSLAVRALNLSSTEASDARAT